MMGPGMGPQTMNNMPIRAGGPSINMRMPMDPHGRMFGGQGRPSPYPNPALYMAQKRHQTPMGYSQAQMGMSPNGGGQYMTRGPFPNGPRVVTRWAIHTTWVVAQAPVSLGCLLEC